MGISIYIFFHLILILLGILFGKNIGRYMGPKLIREGMDHISKRNLTY